MSTVDNSETVDSRPPPVLSSVPMATKPHTRLRPLTSDSLVELAYNSIRQSILAGDFSPGEHLVESRIATELAISRAPVREAMKRLSQEGLTDEKPRRGSFVREITGENLIEIYNARLAIECSAVRLAVRKGASLTPLEETLREMTEVAANRDLAATVELEVLFHEQVVEASGNKYMALIFHSLIGPVRIALGMDDSTYQSLEDVAAEHVPVLEAMSQGDADLAAAAMHDHIVSSLGPVLESFGGRRDELLTHSDLAQGSMPAS